MIIIQRHEEMGENKKSKIMCIKKEISINVPINHHLLALGWIPQKWILYGLYRLSM
jgi:hypothetical protein